MAVTETDIIAARPLINIPKVLFPLDENNNLVSDRLFCLKNGVYGQSSYFGGKENFYVMNYIYLTKIYKDFLKKNIRFGFTLQSIEGLSNITYDANGFFANNNSVTYHMNEYLLSNDFVVLEQNFFHTDSSDRYYSRSYYDVIAAEGDIAQMKIYSTQIGGSGGLGKINYYNLGPLRGQIYTDYYNSSRVDKQPPRSMFYTNIPIFKSEEDSLEWLETGNIEVLKKAVNYGGITTVNNIYGINKTTLQDISLCINPETQKKTSAIIDKIKELCNRYKIDKINNLPVFNILIQKNVLAKTWDEAYFYGEVRYYIKGMNCPVKIYTSVIDNFKHSNKNISPQAILSLVKTNTIYNMEWNLQLKSGSKNSTFTVRHKIACGPDHYEVNNLDIGYNIATKIEIFKEHTCAQLIEMGYDVSNMAKEIIIDTNIPLYFGYNSCLNNLLEDTKNYSIKETTIQNMLEDTKSLQHICFSEEGNELRDNIYTSITDLSPWINIYRETIEKF